jgi:ParB family transcriptional regulator, chromosome partitioning protein
MPDIALSLIWVKRDSRQRRKLEPDPALQASIRRVGLINPIIVTADYQLIAGERRWEACKALGLPTVPVRWMEELNTDELKVIELEENIKRKDLPWQDATIAIAELHRLYGKADTSWNQKRTSEALSLDPGHVSNTLLVAAHMKDPRVAKAATQHEARNLIRRRNERATESEINDLAVFARGMLEQETAKPKPQSLLDGVITPQNPTLEQPTIAATWSRPVVDRTILQEDFLKWAPAYDGNTFNLIHCDFPFGVNVFSGAGQFKPEDQGDAYSNSAYADDTALYWELTECLFNNLDRLLSPVGHLMFWLSPKHHIISRTRAVFGTSLEFYPFPLIWHKSDNSGIIGDSQRWPRHTYEAALLAYRGKRPLVRSVSDSYSGPGDRKLHPSCKPEPMLRHFFTALVDEHTRFLDPTCGAASSLRAAESLGARPENVLGLEIEERFVSVGRESLMSFRVMSQGHELTSRIAGG